MFAFRDCVCEGCSKDEVSGFFFFNNLAPSFVQEYSKPRIECLPEKQLYTMYTDIDSFSHHNLWTSIR